MAVDGPSDSSSSIFISPFTNHCDQAVCLLVQITYYPRDIYRVPNHYFTADMSHLGDLESGVRYSRVYIDYKPASKHIAL
jgi:hypothetical protein